MSFTAPTSWSLVKGMYVLPEGPILRPISSIHEARRFNSLAVLDSGGRLHIVLGRDFKSMDWEFSGNLLAIAGEMASHPYIGVASGVEPYDASVITDNMIDRSVKTPGATALKLATSRPTLISDTIAVAFGRDQTTEVATHIKGLFAVLHAATAGRGSMLYRDDDPMKSAEGVLPQLRSATNVDTQTYTPVVRAGSLPNNWLIGRCATLSPSQPGAFCEAGFLTMWSELVLNIDYIGYLKAFGEHLPHASRSEVKERHNATVEKLASLLPVDFLKQQARIGFNVVVVPNSPVKGSVAPGVYLIKARCSRFYENRLGDNYTNAFNAIGSQFWGTAKRTNNGRYITMPGPLVRSKNLTSPQYATGEQTDYATGQSSAISLTPQPTMKRIIDNICIEDDVEKLLVLAPTHIGSIPMVRIVGPIHPVYYTNTEPVINWTMEQFHNFVMNYPMDNLSSPGTVDSYPATELQMLNGMAEFSVPDHRVGLHSTVNATHGIDVVSLSGLYNAVFSGVNNLSIDKIKGAFPFLTLQVDKTKWDAVATA